MLRLTVPVSLALLVALLACTNPFKAGQMSDASVADFHRKLNQGQFHDIYVNASPDFQKASSEKEINDLFNAIHTKLGDTVAANRTFINLSATTSGNYVRTSYETAFARGKGEETFTWLLVNDHLTLVSYNIQSNDLIVK